MFPDSFGANLAVFLLGQLVAWGYLRTGLVMRGIFVLVLTWVFADAALVLRFGFSDTGSFYVASLCVLQGVVVVDAVVFGWGRMRRRRPEFIARRETAFREAMRFYIRDELDSAAAAFRRLVRGDPWDLPSRVALGSTLSRTGRTREAGRQLVGARRLDRDGRYRDAIEHELRRAREVAEPAT